MRIYACTIKLTFFSFWAIIILNNALCTSHETWVTLLFLCFYCCSVWTDWLTDLWLTVVIFWLNYLFWYSRLESTTKLIDYRWYGKLYVFTVKREWFVENWSFSCCCELYWLTALIDLFMLDWSIHLFRVSSEYSSGSDSSADSEGINLNRNRKLYVLVVKHEWFWWYWRKIAVVYAIYWLTNRLIYVWHIVYLISWQLDMHWF